MPTRMVALAVAHALGERLSPRLKLGDAQQDGVRVLVVDAVPVAQPLKRALAEGATLVVPLRVPAPVEPVARTLEVGETGALTVPEVDACADEDECIDGVDLVLRVEVREAEDVRVAEPGTARLALPGAASAKFMGPKSPPSSAVGLSSTGAPSVHCVPVVMMPYSIKSAPHTPTASRNAQEAAAEPTGCVCCTLHPTSAAQSAGVRLAGEDRYTTYGTNAPGVARRRRPGELMPADASGTHTPLRFTPSPRSDEQGTRGCAKPK